MSLKSLTLALGLALVPGFAMGAMSSQADSQHWKDSSSPHVYACVASEIESLVNSRPGSQQIEVTFLKYHPIKTMGLPMASLANGYFSYTAREMKGSTEYTGSIAVSQHPRRTYDAKARETVTIGATCSVETAGAYTHTLVFTLKDANEKLLYYITGNVEKPQSMLKQ